jgi:nicotinamidase-related amidase
MASQAVRDPLADHLLTPQNSALLLIDYQPKQLKAVRSMDHDLMMKNAASTVKLARLYRVPIVHSTVNVANGQDPTLPALAEQLTDDPPIDRTSMNAWEDLDFLAAVRATGRRKLILCAL